MAQNYIINVSPKLNSSDAQRMETDLNKRFKRVADKFGGALKTVGSITHNPSISHLVTLIFPIFLTSKNVLLLDI